MFISLGVPIYNDDVIVVRLESAVVSLKVRVL